MRLVLPLVLAACVAVPASAAPAKPKPKPAPAPTQKVPVGPDRPSQLPGSAPFVTVNGETIPVSTYIDRMSVAFAPQMREVLVEEALIRGEAKKRGIKPTEAEIDGLVQKAFGDTLRRYGSEENLAKELKATRGWSVADYKAVIREQAAPQILKEKVAASLVKDDEVKDEEIIQRYEANKMQFNVPDTITISHIMVLRPQGATPEKDAAAKAKAQGLLEKALAPGADFAKLAQENSDDKSTGAKGGKIASELVRGAHPFGEVFESKVFNAEPGIIKEVIPTPIGYHVVRLDSKKPGRLLALAEVKKQIQQSILAERRQSAFEKLFVELRTKATIDTGRF
jgi:parvulin-like peptidyl-prolyl isomerase